MTFELVTDELPERNIAGLRDIRTRVFMSWIGDRDAVLWLVDYFELIEFFDDLIDKDKAVTRKRVVDALWKALFDLCAHSFFLRHARTLLPVMHIGINAWMDANELERTPTEQSLHAAYVLRGVCATVIHTTIELTRGRDIMRALSSDVWWFILDENYDSYRLEHSSTGEA